MAIGAAVVGALRTPDLENESIGELSDHVKADLNSGAGAVSQSLREASDKLKAELSDTGAKPCCSRPVQIRRCGKGNLKSS